MNNILVSIICITYNHEKYIKNALEGFVNQKTSFEYEVLIHDDASTDGTTDIIREYTQNYPNIFKPILQVENQYSKGINIIRKHLLPIAKGKYLAFCEGDDYWSDETKLQKQVSFLEKHSDYVACVHNTELYDIKKQIKYAKYDNETKDLYLKDCIYYGAQSFQTSSLVVKKDVYENKPDFVYMIKGVGDYPSAIYYSLCGKIRYIGEIMSIYRYGTPGSWSMRIGTDREAMTRTYMSTINMLKAADDYSNRKYHDLFLKAIAKQKYDMLITQQDYRNALKYKEWFNKEKLIIRLKYLIFSYSPLLLKLRNHYRMRQKNR